MRGKVSSTKIQLPACLRGSFKVSQLKAGVPGVAWIPWSTNIELQSKDAFWDSGAFLRLFDWPSSQFLDLKVQMWSTKFKNGFLGIYIVQSFSQDIYLSSYQEQGLDGLLGVGFLFDNRKIRPLVGVKILSLLLLSRLPCRVWTHLLLSVIIILHSRPDLTIITIIVIMITIAIIHHGTN